MHRKKKMSPNRVEKDKRTSTIHNGKDYCDLRSEFDSVVGLLGRDLFGLPGFNLNHFKKK